LGRIVSNETRNRMSISQNKVDKYWLKGFNKGTDNPRSYKVIQKDLNDNVIKIWDYGKQAAKELNIKYTTLNCCLNKRMKSAGGFKWEKYNNINN